MTGGRLIKVCGMTDGDNIRAVEALGVDFIGFIFYDRSPRCIRGVPSYLPERAARVGVFVNATREEILRRHDAFRFDYVQLHGDESPDFCRRLKEQDGLGVIKALGAGADLRGKAPAYARTCDYLLFDTKTAGYGGSGLRFDWSLLEAYREPTGFFLSGGIGPDSPEALQAFSHPSLAGYDLNSLFETAPGRKDTALLQSFLDRLQQPAR